MFMPVARDLDLRHLQALDAVATEGTFGRAAERLGYTQSAVSQQIGALEKLLGAPVFDRPGGPRPVELTPLGALVLDRAREVLGRVEVLAADVERFGRGQVGRLDLGTFESISVAVLPQILRSMRAELPQLEIRPFETDDDIVLAAKVLDGELEVSFFVGDVPDGLDHVELRHDPWLLVALPDEVPDGPVPVGRVTAAPLIGQSTNSCQRWLDAGLRAAGHQPDYVFRTNDNGAVVAMVRAGMGMAIMPQLALDPTDTSVAIRALDPPIPPRIISLVWRSNRTLSPGAARFIDLATEAFAALPDPGVD